FVLVGFLALFAFFDVVNELKDLGRGNYGLREVFLYVLLSLPTHAYELFPIVVLIGTLYVLSHLASNSEYTVMRASGLSPARTAGSLARLGLVFFLATFIIGEWVAPRAEEAAQKVRLRAMGSLIGDQMSSGLWFKDERSFINVREARQANRLEGVRIYDFDARERLRSATAAAQAEYKGDGVWHLTEVAQTRFSEEGPRVSRYKSLEWRSAVSPDLLDALLVKP